MLVKYADQLGGYIKFLQHYHGDLVDMLEKTFNAVRYDRRDVTKYITRIVYGKDALGNRCVKEPFESFDEYFRRVFKQSLDYDELILLKIEELKTDISNTKLRGEIDDCIKEIQKITCEIGYKFLETLKNFYAESCQMSSEEESELHQEHYESSSCSENSDC